VLSLLYLIYNAESNTLSPALLRHEAVRLATTLVDQMPDKPEAAGLFALLLLSEA
jgi:RNA polymerase sigma-70 factor (ECF subfamily)